MLQQIKIIVQPFPFAPLFREADADVLPEEEGTLSPCGKGTSYLNGK